MPLWLVLALAGVVLAALGFGGVGDILIWIGDVLLLVALVAIILSLRRSRLRRASATTVPDEPQPSAAPRLTWQRRSARLGWTALVLAVLAAVMLGGSIWMLATQQPRIVPDDQQVAVDAATAMLPVDVQIAAPRPGIMIGLGLGLAAGLVGMLAFQAAVAMRVLSRGRGLVEPISGTAAVMTRRVLGPVATRALEVDRLPDWPVSAFPPEADAPGLTLHCTVVIPAHDEEAVLGRTLASLESQTRPPARVLVVADNCTDATVRIALENGSEVFETVGNTDHKAGALNQALDTLLQDDGADHVVLVMDADSTIGPQFLEVAMGLLEDDIDLMAVGGLFSGEEGAGLLGQAQRNEFTRYQRTLTRREGRVFVLTGTASVFRAYALRAVAESRGSLVPGSHGHVYDTLALTEDNELTLALKSLGAELRSPTECRVVTEVMPTWRALWRQRLRWQRGAVENVAAYGFTRTTAQYWGQQLALGYGVLALNSYLLMLAIALLATDNIMWSPFWLAVGSIFFVERVLTAWAAGWRGRLLAAPLVLELAYALALQWCFVTSLVQIATHKRAGWNYVPRPAMAAFALPALVPFVVPAWSPLPYSVLQSSWFEALGLFVGINTLFFAALSLFQLLPPIRKTAHRLVRLRAGDGS